MPQNVLGLSRYVGVCARLVLFARLAAWALIGLVAMAALPACEDAATGATADAAIPEDADDAADDAVGDAAVGDAAAADASDGDANPIDAKPNDAKPTDAADSTAAAKGCKGDLDCNNLALTSCQLATCDLKTGLCQAQNLPDDATCTAEAQDSCKSDPRCKAGKCQYSMVSCDDGNGCTADSCESVGGCSSAPISPAGGVVPCLDGSACTILANCVVGVCTKLKSLDCDDKQPCTTDACDPKTGCTHEPTKDGQSCSDGKYCTENDSCKKGACTGAATVCPDDGKPCTLANCAEIIMGCSTVPKEGLLCDDGLPCTAKDVCNAAGDCAGVPLVCDDKNPCTDDTCDPAKGCLHKDNALPCAGDACLTGGQCSGGKCAGELLTCNDGNLCTQDSCDKTLGCQAKPWPAPCWDGNACTLEDTCAAGVCKGSGELKCDDGNLCSVDTCDPSKGCGHVASAPGASCASGKTCTAGLCLANSCGDGWCSSAESSASCLQDCPEDGGACQSGDSTCLASCTAAKCKVQSDACAATQGCKDVGSCLVGCGSDLGCMVTCLTGAPGKAAEVFGAYDQCMQAFCVKDFWMGKKCGGAGSQYVQCVDACEGAMCKSMVLQCKASTGCVAVRDCLKSCTQADPVPCITDCKTKGSQADGLLNAALDDCDKTYCL